MRTSISSVEREPVRGTAKSGLSEELKLRTTDNESFILQGFVKEYRVSTM